MPPPPSMSTTIYLLDRPGVQQSYVFVGTLGPDRSSPDFAALEVMAPILGGSSGSRLYDNLRQRHSYMYSGTPATVNWRREPLPSVIGGSAAVATAKTDSALIEWLGELRAIRDREPTEREMTLARGALTGALPAQIETDDLIANRVMAMVQNGVPLDFYNSYGARIASVKPGQVRSAAAEYLDLSHLVIVIAGDRRVIEPALRAANIAPIVIVDENGKP
jgi:zinc protease